MYLKRLEIQGFKSFADKVEFEFPSGITAIVGPNGSGKSNVVDSIRWVLGEQSVKNLRGGKMEDVIFAGSSDRRPVGMAQVSITLDNSSRLFDLDFEEVTVTRRLYRSGESEYFINKSACRLKDIHELFMDTGLGREGLSIISQGKVDEILTLKPEDRRGLIEEAAGIIKYKYRKREAERKLNDTEENLVRIDDIISELQERVVPLGEQAAKAQSYKEWKGQLDQLEVSLEVFEIEKNRIRETALMEQQTAVSDHLTKASAQMNKREAELAGEKLQEQEEEQALGKLQQTFYELQTTLERKQNEIQSARQFQESFKEQRQKRSSEIAIQIEEQQTLIQETADKQAEAAHNQEAYQKEQRQTAELKRQSLEQESLLRKWQKQLEENHQASFENMQEQARIHNEIQRLTEEVAGGGRRKQKALDKIAQLNKELSDLMETYQQIEKQHTEVMEAQAAHYQSIHHQEKALEQRKQQQFVMRQALNALQMRQQEVSSKAQALKELEQSGEGYQYGVKSILEYKNQGRLSGIIGTVAQLITVPLHLEKAIETAMGVSLQNLVTENDSQAQEAIAYLKKHHKGRATFLPLNTVRGQRAEENLHKEDHVLGLAVDLIQFEDRYENILLHLLGKVWVVEDLASAVAIGKKRGFSHRLVTLDGELITPGGALTGGNHGKERGGLLQRQRQIHALEAESTQLLAEMEDKNQALDAYYVETNSQKEKLAALQRSSSDFIKTITELEQQSAHLGQERKRLETDLELEQHTLEGMNSDLEAAAKKLTESEVRRERLAKREQQLTDQLQQLKQMQSQGERDLRQLQETFHQSDVQLATALERWQLLQVQAQESQKRLDNLTAQLEVRKRELSHLECREQEEQQRIAESTLQVQSDTKELQEMNVVLAQKKAIHTERRERIQKLEEEIRKLRQEFDRMGQKKYHIEIELNKVQGILHSAYRRLEQNFGFDLASACAVRIPVENPEDVQKRIQQLKGQLSSLGEINFTAIEEFEQVKRRMEFLTEQMHDLEEAKQSLNKIIKEMERIMAEKFRETYQEVNAKFADVFEAMFGGGRARLELSDPEDYLLTGIEIIAQPPGKKEQVLSLLSGGERAMTAIALLFSLLSVKPSPFCILDEIESALDDANIERFARFLKEYEDKTQFLIISHRKGTMEAADALFGVSMENKGVSRLMSVKISDFAS